MCFFHFPECSMTVCRNHVAKFRTSGSSESSRLLEACLQGTDVGIYFYYHHPCSMRRLATDTAMRQLTSQDMWPSRAEEVRTLVHVCERHVRWRWEGELEKSLQRSSSTVSQERGINSSTWFWWCWCHDWNRTSDGRRKRSCDRWSRRHPPPAVERSLELTRTVLARRLRVLWCHVVPPGHCGKAVHDRQAVFKCMAIIIKEMLDDNNKNTTCALPQNRSRSTYFSFASDWNLLFKYIISSTQFLKGDLISHAARKHHLLASYSKQPSGPYRACAGEFWRWRWVPGSDALKSTSRFRDVFKMFSPGSISVLHECFPPQHPLNSSVDSLKRLLAVLHWADDGRQNAERLRSFALLHKAPTSTAAHRQDTARMWGAEPDSSWLNWWVWMEEAGLCQHPWVCVVGEQRGNSDL